MTPEEFRDRPAADRITAGLDPIKPAPRPKAARAHRGPRASPNPPGRPPYVPTSAHRTMVTTLRGAGVHLDTIAELLGIAPSTVEEHFRQELTTGKDQIVARIAGRVVQKALAGDNAMMVFYLKNHGGEQWRDKQRHEHGGLDGAPLVPPNLVIGFLQPLEPTALPEPPSAD